MKLAGWLLLAIAVLLLFSVGGYLLVQENITRPNKTSQSRYDYLQQASQITISQMDYNNSNQTVKSILLLDSSEQSKIHSFLQIINEQLELAEIETEFSPKHAFSPDYRVKLACKKSAVIDFVFYESINAACMKNEDFFFYAELKPESVKILKEYFNQLK